MCKKWGDASIAFYVLQRKFAERFPIYGVTMWYNRALKGTLAKELESMGISVYAHTVNDKIILERLNKVGVWGVYKDYLKLKDLE